MNTIFFFLLLLEEIVLEANKQQLSFHVSKYPEGKGFTHAVTLPTVNNSLFQSRLRDLSYIAGRW